MHAGSPCIFLVCSLQTEAAHPGARRARARRDLPKADRVARRLATSPRPRPRPRPRRYPRPRPYYSQYSVLTVLVLYY